MLLCRPLPPSQLSQSAGELFTCVGFKITWIIQSLWENSRICCRSLHLFILCSYPCFLYLLAWWKKRQGKKQTGGSFVATLPADPGGLTGSRCSSYETNSCLDKRCFEDPGSVRVGGPNGKGQNLSKKWEKKGFGIIEWERKSLRGGEEERRCREEIERGREEVGGNQPAKKLLKRAQDGQRKEVRLPHWKN